MPAEILPALVPAPSSLPPHAAPPWPLPELHLSALRPDWLSDFSYTVLALGLWLGAWLVLKLMREEGLTRSFAHVTRHVSMVAFAIALGVEFNAFYERYLKTDAWQAQVHQEWGYLLSEPTPRADKAAPSVKGSEVYSITLRTWPHGRSGPAREDRHLLELAPTERAAYPKHHYVLLRRLTHAARETRHIYEVIAADGRRLSVRPWRVSGRELLSREEAKRMDLNARP